MEKDMADIDYSQFQLEANKLMKEVHHLLLRNNKTDAVNKLDEVMAELKLMKTAIKYHA
jgi:hypothetical protein